MTDLKTIKLHLETKLHRQQNQDTQQTEQQPINRQPIDKKD